MVEYQAGRLVHHATVVGYFILREGGACTFTRQEVWSEAISQLVARGYRVAVDHVIDVEAPRWPGMS